MSTRPHFPMYRTGIHETSAPPRPLRAGELQVVGSHMNFHVYFGTQRLAGPFKNIANAISAATAIERRSHIRERACLTCGTTFQSEGPHNRMCNSCRGGGYLEAI